MPRPCQINGVPIKTPSKMKPSIEDLSSEATGRDLTGWAHKDIVMEADYWDLEWETINWVDLSLILNLVKEKPSFTFRFPNPYTPYQWITGEYYVGKRSYEVFDLSRKDMEYKNLQMQFTKVK